jgi:hypothetical protein
MSLIITTVDPAKARRAQRGVESAFGAALFCPEVGQAIAALGVELKDLIELNMVTRVAPMGAIPAEVAWSVFYNHNPDIAAGLFPRVWEQASPAAVLAAQSAAFSGPLAAALSVIAPADLAELALLARTAGQAAAANHEGRPLLAGLASLPWPEEDHLAIWHAGKVLREHRGDGHVAALVVEGLTSVEVLVVHAAFEPNLTEGVLRASRKWPRANWDDAVAGLRKRGWLTDDETLTLTPEGRERRQWIEDRTDLLACVAYEPIGNDGMDRMAELGKQVARAIHKAGLTITAASFPPPVD